MAKKKAASNKHSSGRFKMLLIAALCAAPVVAAYLAYNYWPPAGRVNYGDLITLQSLPGTTLKQLDGKPFRFSDAKGKWLMISIDPASCAKACEDKLFLMRQLRLMQGRDMDRIERVFLITDEAPLTTLLIREYEDMRMLRVPANADGVALLQAFPAADSPNNHIYLADPQGRLMMRFPDHPDPKRMKKDLEILFKAQGSLE
jgi:hypothetical protein